MKNELSTNEISELSKCEKTIEQTQNSFVECGLAIAKIRDSKLYRQDYDTFEEYCKSKWGWTKSRANQLIQAANVVESLNDNHGCQNDNVYNCIQNENGNHGSQINERQARALSSVPKEDRQEVLEKAAKSGKVTAKSITEAAKMSPIGDKSKEIPVDKTGWPIPEEILENWNRADTLGRELVKISSHLKCTIKNAMEDQDVLFAEVSNSAPTYAQNLYTSLNQLIPYVVCTSCQGRNSKKCTLCRGRGFFSEFKYKTVIPEELKAIRLKTLAKK